MLQLTLPGQRSSLRDIRAGTPVGTEAEIVEECGLPACAQGHLPKETAHCMVYAPLFLEQAKKGSWKGNSKRL